MWDLSSSTRDQTCAPALEVQFKPLDHQGSPWIHFKEKNILLTLALNGSHYLGGWAFYYFPVLLGEGVEILPKSQTWLLNGSLLLCNDIFQMGTPSGYWPPREVKEVFVSRGKVFLCK